MVFLGSTLTYIQNHVVGLFTFGILIFLLYKAYECGMWQKVGEAGEKFRLKIKERKMRREGIEIPKPPKSLDALKEEVKEAEKRKKEKQERIKLEAKLAKIKAEEEKK